MLDPLARRLAYVTGARLAFLTVLLAATTVFYLGGELARFPFSVRVVFISIGAAYALAGVYAAVLRRGRNLRALATTQLVFDQLTWTAIVYVSGGATSGATSFYALTALVGALLLGVRAAVVTAAIGFTLYLALCAAFDLRLVAPPPDQVATTYALTTSSLAFPLLVNGIGISTVAGLGGYLAHRLHITGDELAEANVRAQRAEHLAELGRIAAWLAHEIRNPLGSIKGSIEMLRESTSLSAEDKELCGIVQRETTRLNELVEDMLEFSRPRPAEPGDVDVAKLARDVTALAQVGRSVGEVSVRYEGPPGAALARCDASQMRQVLWNLLRNALQASLPGTEVVVAVIPRGGEVELAVQDQGPGLGAEARSKIFDAFYTTRSHGAGIGLAVVKRIVDEHASVGARIEVDSMPVPSASSGSGGSTGATFRISLRAAGEFMAASGSPGQSGSTGAKSPKLA